MKVWCFNCYGVCVAYLKVEDIAKWNETHRIHSKRIVDWKE